MEDLDKFKSKYLSRLDEELGGGKEKEVSSRVYHQFKKEYMPRHHSLYEKVCKISGNFLKVSPGKKKEPELQRVLDISHLDLKPVDVVSFSILGPLLFILVTSLLGFLLPVFLSPKPGGGSVFMVVLSVISGLILMFVLQKVPFFLANSWRMKASNQMVLCIFYLVTYMRHTSNLERALDFAAEHLGPPLSLDLKKILWDIETSKYETLKEALDDYLETWKEWNKEFIESVHLVEASLYENSESRRLDSLDKSLSVMLSETYERMLHYAHNMKSPIQALHMLGIVLPILGLVILPLMVSFIPEVDWFHIAVIYNIVLPIMVFYMGKNILSKRPTGYGETNVGDQNPEYRKLKRVSIKIGKSEIGINPVWLSVSVFVVLILIGIFPLLIHAMVPNFDWVLSKAGGITAIGSYQSQDALFYFLGYRPLVIDGDIMDIFVGPFGIGATMLSIFIPLAFGISIGLYYRFKSGKLIKIRKQAKELENEFAAALFQLGNRLADGLPAEVAFAKVAAVMEDTTSGKFFKLVAINITRLGMGLEEAIFDEGKGALTYYPSSIIESSMKVLVQASKKGPMVASQAVINVSQYIKEMHRVDERLKDLMADIVSDMKAQISFLTPAIAGIVIGITSMITKILGSLGENITNIATDSASAQGFGGGLLGIFGTGIPTYFFQAIVGVYVVQVVYILTVIVNGIENGSDKLMEESMLGHYLVRTTVTYCIIASIVMVLFNFIAGTIVVA